VRGLQNTPPYPAAIIYSLTAQEKLRSQLINIPNFKQKLWGKGGETLLGVITDMNNISISETII
jgi:hypothetical protein